jgi:hypothetical protein
MDISRGWLTKLKLIPLEEYSLFYMALLQKRPSFKELTNASVIPTDTSRGVAHKIKINSQRPEQAETETCTVLGS